jgi:hypothetical protein
MRPLSQCGSARTGSTTPAQRDVSHKKNQQLRLSGLHPPLSLNSLDTVSSGTVAQQQQGETLRPSFTFTLHPPLVYPLLIDSKPATDQNESEEGEGSFYTLLPSFALPPRPLHRPSSDYAAESFAQQSIVSSSKAHDVVKPDGAAAFVTITDSETSNTSAQIVKPYRRAGGSGFHSRVYRAPRQRRQQKISSRRELRHSSSGAYSISDREGVPGRKRQNSMSPSKTDGNQPAVTEGQAQMLEDETMSSGIATEWRTASSFRTD